MFPFNFEDGASNSDRAEDCKVDPSKLLLEAMTEDDDSSEEEDGYVNDKFRIGDAFCSRDHCGRRYEVSNKRGEICFYI